MAARKPGPRGPFEQPSPTRGKKPGEKFGGRKPGVLNKLPRVAKEALAAAFEELGGQQGLVEWAQENNENLKIFYSVIWPKLLPLQVKGDIDLTARIHRVEREVVRPQNTNR